MCTNPNILTKTIKSWSAKSAFMLFCLTNTALIVHIATTEIVTLKINFEVKSLHRSIYVWTTFAKQFIRRGCIKIDCQNNIFRTRVIARANSFSVFYIKCRCLKTLIFLVKKSEFIAKSLMDSQPKIIQFICGLK